MSELTVEPRQGGGYVVIWPNGDKAEWPLNSEAFRYTIADRRRRLRELEAIEEYLQRQPEIPVGTTGTATVRGVEGVRVMRLQQASDAGDGVNVWRSATFVNSHGLHDAEYVTDFVPDTLLTDEAAEKIRADERERIANRTLVSEHAPIELKTAPQPVRKALFDWLKAGAR